MSIVYHRDKKTGSTFAYESLSYRDPVTRKPRTRQTYIGKLNKETNKIETTNHKTKKKKNPITPDSQETISEGISSNCRIAGPYMLLDKLASDTGLFDKLKQCFPDTYLEILSVVYYIIHKGQALYRCESWSDRYLHPFLKSISSQRISELLLEITEDHRQKFLSLWLNYIKEKDFLCYDITSISSYSESNAFIRYGYNRDGEKLPQINLAMLFGQNSGLPAYYRLMPGSITDVQTIKTTITNLHFLGIDKLRFVLDRGFYSRNNIRALLECNYNFTLSVPTSRLWIEKIIDQYHEQICLPDNYHEINKNEVIYAVTQLYKWEKSNRRIYVHIYYQDSKATINHGQFIHELLKYKDELDSGNRIASHEIYYERYFIIKETPKRGITIKFNNQAILTHRKRYAGYFCLMSTHIKDPIEALEIYRNKDVVENCFDDLKNHSDMNRIRVHSAEAMHNRIFLQFLAVILLSEMRLTTKKTKILKHMSIKEILEELETLIQIEYDGHYKKYYNETTKTQKKILEAFALDWPQ